MTVVLVYLQLKTSICLQVSKEAVALQLQESWWREYQVLPGRTHPEMMTSGTGGYVLSGIRVSS
jgi:tRNA (adenine-N(1)-)-methyltransferase non-catalytic subunit